jgi:hypothetical protein
VLYSTEITLITTFALLICELGMRFGIILSVVVAVLVIGGGIGFYELTTSGSSTPQSTTLQTQTTQNDFGCAKPAVVYQYTCDTLPQGYVIPPRLPNAPAPYCPSQMTSSACALFMKTFGTGVCTPNETTFTDPLDCGCTGSLLADPYTGRCNVPATVCQQQAVIQAAKGGGG